ncbi:unnamed protein product, partial [Discosporangium mesarthrocarpum]
MGVRDALKELLKDTLHHVYVPPMARESGAPQFEKLQLRNPPKFKAAGETTGSGSGALGQSTSGPGVDKDKDKDKDKSGREKGGGRDKEDTLEAGEVQDAQSLIPPVLSSPGGMGAGTG